MPAIYPVFKKLLPTADSFNGMSLSRCLPQLDEIATNTKVTPLSRFIDSNTMARELLEDEQLANMKVPPVSWLEPEEGLLTVRRILAAIQEGDIRFQSRRGDDTDRVISELKQLEALLVSAADEGNRFHLLVDM
jgi:hypothetical protein